MSDPVMGRVLLDNLILCQAHISRQYFELISRKARGPVLWGNLLGSRQLRLSNEEGTMQCIRVDAS